LSDKKISFENVLKKAEESRRQAERLSEELNKIKHEKDNELLEIKLEKEKIIKEREKIYTNAKQETKRIVADKLSEAEEIIEELKTILKKADLESREVFRASELKNRLKNSRYLDVDNDNSPIEMRAVGDKDLIVGRRVYVKSLGVYATILSVKKKSEVEVAFGNIKTVVKRNDLFNSELVEDKKETVKVFKGTLNNQPKTEINVLGKDSFETLEEVRNFIDQAVVLGLEEIKIIHGIGGGILLKAIREYLKTDKNVLEFRRGKYGEGENGVTIIKLK